MFQKNKTLFFTVLYVLLCLITMFLVIENNKMLQPFIKPFIPITLFLYYSFSVKKIEPLYVTMLFMAMVGQLFMILPYNYFVFSLLAYLVFHLIATIFIFKKFLLKKSVFDIFTFALPFFMSFSTIFFLIYKNLNNDLIPVFFFGIIGAINGSVVLLNYSQQQNIPNYLIFIGLFTVISADANASLFVYGEGSIIFYHLLILLDQLGQYAICRGIILKEQENEMFKLVK